MISLIWLPWLEFLFTTNLPHHYHCLLTLADLLAWNDKLHKHIQHTSKRLDATVAVKNSISMLNILQHVDVWKILVECWSVPLWGCWSNRNIAREHFQSFFIWKETQLFQRMWTFSKSYFLLCCDPFSSFAPQDPKWCIDVSIIRWQHIMTESV